MFLDDEETDLRISRVSFCVKIKKGKIRRFKLHYRSCRKVLSLTYFVDDGPDLKCLIDGVSRSQEEFWLRKNINWLEAESIMRQPAKISDQIDVDEFLRFFLL